MSLPAKSIVFQYQAAAWFPTARCPIALVRSRHRGSAPIHTHDFNEIVFVKSGTGVHVIGEPEDHVEVAAGDVLFVAAEEHHGYNQCVDLVIDNLIFRPDLMSGPERLAAIDAHALIEPIYRLPAALRRAHLAGDSREAAWKSLADIESEITLRRPGFQAMVFARFLDCLVATGRQARTTCDEPRPNHNLARAATASSVNAAIEYIRLHFPEPITLSSIASAACLTPTYLSEVFRAQTGQTPWQYVTGLRIAHAKQLFASHPSLTITQVGFASGFADPAYFARVFRASIGCSPTQYRSGESEKSPDME